VDFILDRHRRGYHATKTSFRQLAIDIARELDAKTTFCASDEWFGAFMARNPSVSVRLSEAINYGRVSGYTRENLLTWFKWWEEEAKRYTRASQIINIDMKGYSPEDAAENARASTVNGQAQPAAGGPRPARHREATTMPGGPTA
jgi:hypothetical protein